MNLNSILNKAVRDITAFPVTKSETRKILKDIILTIVESAPCENDIGCSCGCEFNDSCLCTLRKYGYGLHVKEIKKWKNKLTKQLKLFR